MNDLTTTEGGGTHRRPIHKRHELVHVMRPRLLHVLPRGGVCSLSLFVLDLVRELQAYEHVLVYTTPIQQMSDGFLWHAQSTGADLLQIDDVIEIATWKDINTYSAAIFYDVPSIKLPIPTLYYAYSKTADVQTYDVLLAASDYAAQQLQIVPDYVIPPAIQSRVLRGLYRPPKQRPANMFCVGLFSMGTQEKYPVAELQCLLQQLPADVKLLISDPGDLLRTIKRPNTYAYPREIGAHWYGMQMSDILIYAHGGGYVPLYGRLCTEMQASGVPVLCQRIGAPAERCKEGVDILFYDKPEELSGKIELLRQDKALSAGLGANAQLQAGWHDLTIHIGTLKGVLRELGV